MFNRSRKSSKIIHVRLRPHSKRIHASKQLHSSIHRHRRKVSPTNQPSLSSSSVQSRACQKTADDRGLMKSDRTTSSVTIQLQKDTKGIINDHHREKKAKKPWAKITLIVAILTIIVIFVVLSVTLGVLLTKTTTINRQRGPPAILRWNVTGTVVAGLGAGGTSTNPVVSPLGFTFDEAERIYIAEHWGHRVTRWNLSAQNGTLIAGSGNGNPSNASNGLYCPSDILLETNGDMYVTDRRNHRLQFWPSGASSGITLAGVGSGTSISLNMPQKLSRNMNTKEIYIASTYSHTIVAYPSGAIFGINNIVGSTSPCLNFPEGLVFDSFTNSLIIANGFGHNIVRWTLGSTNWTLVAGVPGVLGNDSMHLYRPIGLTMDPMGNIYAADFNNQRVQLFMNGQTQGITIARTGRNGTVNGRTGDVKLDSQLNLFVADHDLNHIIKFSRY